MGEHSTRLLSRRHASHTSAAVHLRRENSTESSDSVLIRLRVYGRGLFKAVEWVDT